eukprot:m.414939 g.414939  ORF g.414939 m.414939 type:complete len:51 (+) comp56594_c0_seq5:149-301(+)
MTVAVALGSSNERGQNLYIPTNRAHLKPVEQLSLSDSPTAVFWPTEPSAP